MGLVKHLTKNEKNWQVQIRDFAQGKKLPQKNINGKNWITWFLIRHPILAAKFAGRVDRQRATASNSRIINDRFKKLGKTMRSNWFIFRAITNVYKRGFIMGVSPRTRELLVGEKKPRVKQHGKRDFITALEAVSADGFAFPPYLTGKGSSFI